MVSNRPRGIVTYTACLILCTLLLGLFGQAAAQTAATASLSAPDPKAFPTIETYLDVRNASGQFVHGLDASSLQIIENGQPAPLTGISELRPGVQLVVALNPGPAFAVHNSQGVSRLQIIEGYLSQWAQSRQGSSLDDLSLLVTGAEIGKSHISDPTEWLNLLTASAAENPDAVPNFDTLVQAVDLAADKVQRPGMGRAVLFITPAPNNQGARAIQNLVERAKQQDITIFVWMVAPAGAPLPEAAKTLQDLTTQTGGAFSTLSGEESPPDIEALIQPLRSIYQVRYTSASSGNGERQVYASLQVDGQVITTTARTYSLDIQPPDPAFINPALEIVRKAPATVDATEKAYEVPVEDLQPGSQDLHILVDFPDGRIRPLAATRLLVDGKVVAENLTAPFDQFKWDLSQYGTSGEHLLKVEATDSLGLTGVSLETAVQVNVNRPAPTVVDAVTRNIPALAGLGVVVIGAVVLLGLVLGGQIQPYAELIRKQRLRRKTKLAKEAKAKEEAAHSRPSWANRLQWPQKRAVPLAYAYLARISDPVHQPTAPPVPITAEEVTLGSDPNQSTLVLNDPSVAPLHARLKRLEDGCFTLADQGSVAGTWINYTPVSPEGMKLEHGDLVHIGRLEFRFNLRKPAYTRKPVVTASNIQKERAL
ncbi:MAG: FHA domain-containing protein [Omnitrophica WOR_2 bacterium]